MPELTHIPIAELGEQLIDRGMRPGADVPPAAVRALELAGHAGARIGVWECGPGGWPIRNRPDREICVILDGEARITDESTGAVVLVRSGDVLDLPVGWSGRWDIDRSVRKVFATLPGDQDG